MFLAPLVQCNSLGLGAFILLNSVILRSWITKVNKIKLCCEQHSLSQTQESYPTARAQEAVADYPVNM